VKNWGIWFSSIILLLSGNTPIHAQNEDVQTHRDHGAVASFDRSKVPRKASQSRWGEDYFPNTALVTHEGVSVRFFDDLIKDKVVVINFIYASCPDACPLDTARLAKVQQILGDRVGRDIFMYSITIDPDRDTPEVLAEYAKRFQAGPGWLFLTGNEADILLLRKKLGLYIAGLDKASKDHNMSLLMGNQRTGQWMKRSPMDSPYFIAEQVGSWLTNWQQPSVISNDNYAHAPELQIPTKGEYLFRTRCIVCHTIGVGVVRTVGGGESIEANQQRLGPDLLHVVQKRGRTWLTNWLANPEQMLAQRDPVVMQLYNEWNEVLMPNLHLNDIEINALVEYMDAETYKVVQGGNE
jgi:protein SCO1/2